MEDAASIRMRENADAANGGLSTPMSPGSSGSPQEGKVKNWLKTKFSRRMSKGQKSTSSDKEPEAAGADKGFIGGAALTGASANNSAVSLGAHSTSRDAATTGAPVAAASEIPSTEAKPSVVDTTAKSAVTEPDAKLDSDAAVSPVSATTAAAPVLVATALPESSAAPPMESKVLPTTEPEEEEERGRRISAVSALSEPRDDEEFQEARDNFDEDLAPPPTFPAEKAGSPARTAKFHEEI